MDQSPRQGCHGVFLLKALLLATLTLAASLAFPQAPSSRAEALEARASADTARRATSVVWIAQRGTEADAGLLHERLRDESGLVRAYAERALWLVWARSGDSAVDELLLRGIDEMEAGELTDAVAIFTEVIQKKPEFAEGWNRRATALHLAGDYRASLADCDEALKRNPRHFGALSGAGLNHLQLGDPEAALVWFRRALEVNPNMTAVEMEIQRLQLQQAKPAKG
jgi:tetratricopeptide (TPR) repeat protein